MANALVPEFAVTDWRTSLRFYVDILGSEIRYQRPEEGFAYLGLGAAELMIDSLAHGRTFGGPYRPTKPPFGRGLNVQIQVPAVAPLLARLQQAGVEPVIPLEEVWCRQDAMELGNRQFVVADPDGYLLRFFEDLGARPAC